MKYLTVTQVKAEQEQVQKHLNQVTFNDPLDPDEIRIRNWFKIFTDNPAKPKVFYTDADNPLQMHAPRLIVTKVYNEAKEAYTQALTQYLFEYAPTLTPYQVTECFAKVWELLFYKYAFDYSTHHSLSMASNYVLAELVGKGQVTNFRFIDAMVLTESKKDALKTVRADLCGDFLYDDTRREYEKYVTYLSTATKRKLSALAQVSALNEHNKDYVQLLQAYFQSMWLMIEIDYEAHWQKMEDFILSLVRKQQDYASPVHEFFREFIYGSREDEALDVFFHLQVSWENIFGQTEKAGWPSFAQLGIKIKTFDEWSEHEATKKKKTKG